MLLMFLAVSPKEFPKITHTIILKATQ